MLSGPHLCLAEQVDSERQPVGTAALQLQREEAEGQRGAPRLPQQREVSQAQQQPLRQQGQVLRRGHAATGGGRGAQQACQRWGLAGQHHRMELEWT